MDMQSIRASNPDYKNDVQWLEPMWSAYCELLCNLPRSAQ